jgi:hypothetical protein
MLNRVAHVRSPPANIARRRELLQEFAPPAYSEDVYAGIRQNVWRQIESESTTVVSVGTNCRLVQTAYDLGRSVRPVGYYAGVRHFVDWQSIDHLGKSCGSCSQMNRDESNKEIVALPPRDTSTPSSLASREG